MSIRDGYRPSSIRQRKSSHLRHHCPSKVDDATRQKCSCQSPPQLAIQLVADKLDLLLLRS
ncbi:Uncharacterized protein APZ42_013983 [Daphnia magna]|uniref:Uncharacterized protein n=1 Tax=Daphnia magna TaxID=35525 RepID=A0A162QBP6_9CRUS|nr:Uncharacterized protein APZ42_013983 [Daphnia magna]